MDSVTIAGVDCGTNSIRLMIAEVDEHGLHVVTPRILRIIRLGQGVDKNRRFADDALQRAYAAVKEFADVLSRHHVDDLRFVATSATRDAANRNDFEDEVESILGVRPEVIPGSEEAALSFLGATATLHSTQDQARPQPPYMVVDLGGGSTELVVGGDGNAVPAHNVRSGFSMNIGSVRMSERHLLADPPTEEQIEEATADIDAHIDEAFTHIPAQDVSTIIGVSGTVTTMSAIAMGCQSYDRHAVDGARINFDDAFEADDRILRMSREERGRVGAIHPGRIDVVGGGALIWTRVLTRVASAAATRGRHIDSFLASEHGLLDGIVLDRGRKMLAGLI
ncbi:Ppx/GppA phosphatase family protein [Bifidobacterium aquikefiri]|uniref:Ppx/GppA phosphatase family protein n=1 Tax=Bifidobacterium aquikefiri TaxID=1653207 RepID=UPI0023F1DBD6|nr:Ppx/GppA phosphatase family protein [Bifidobacterium aquikefiri]